MIKEEELAKIVKTDILCSDYFRPLNRLISESFLHGYQYAVQHQWIKSSDMLPHEFSRTKGFENHSEDVICRSPTGIVFVGYTNYVDGKWVWSTSTNMEVEYWMPIPELDVEV